MTAEVEPLLKFRREVPKDHKASIDTRIRWMWIQRFGTIQMIWKESPDALDRTAATLMMQCMLGGGDLESIELVFRRLEGGPVVDQELLEGGSLPV